MAPIDQIAIGRVGFESLADAAGLTVEANWNQTEDDWKFFVAHATVFGARDALGKLVATAAILPYSGGFAWISLVIVAKSCRGQGLGTRMLNECISGLRERALVGMLDATPAGARIYRPLGFKPIMGIKRWEGRGGGVVTHDGSVQPLALSSIPKVARFDTRAFGANREPLLKHYCERSGTRAFGLGQRAYAMVRAGRVAAQLGPLVAANEHDALVLLDAAIASRSGSIFVDVPDAWTQIAAALGARGFRVQRSFIRMALGQQMPYGDPPQIFAIAGPEYG